MKLTLTSTRKRVHSIDILRGIIMLMMALDHVRDYLHISAFTQDPLNLETTTTPLFFTRWVTHFCAPIFVFLSGVSACISGQKKTKAELSSFLIRRGLWLVFVELAIVTLFITFNPLYNVFILQVIWAIGWSMVILGLLVRTSYTTIVVVGLILLLGHNILDFYPAARGSKWIELLLTSRTAFWQLGPQNFVLVAYAILPWTGILLLGYGSGKIFSAGFDEARRKKLLLYAGFGLLLLFVLLRVTRIYGDPGQWKEQPDSWFTFLSFLNVTKYPPSLQFVCITLGVALLALWLFENAKGWFANILMVYGRVPFFYYILHFFLAHLIGVIFFFASGRTTAEIIDPQSPMLFRPLDFGFGLKVVYLAWLALIILLYWPCKWFAGVKAKRKDWWLSYI